MQKIIFPNDIMIEITNYCNLNCATCYANRDNRKKEYMSFDFFKYIIDQIPDKNNKTISLYNFGEPLLHKDVGLFIKYAKSSGIKNIKIATNGHPLNLRKGIDIIKSGLDYISISLDGTNQESYEKFRIGGNFNLVIKNIINFVKLRNKLSKLPIIEIQFIITNENYNEINKIETLAKNLGVDILKLKRVEITEKEWNYLDPPIEYSRYKKLGNIKNYCKKPKESIVINVDGKLLPCCYITDKYLNSHNLGNAHNKKIIDLLEENENLINQISKNKNEINYCKTCSEGSNEIYYKTIYLQ